MKIVSIIFLAIFAFYDWATTAIGLAGIFGSNSIQTYIFSAVAASFFSFILVTTFTIKSCGHSWPDWIKILLWSFWMLVLFLDLYTTSVGNTVLATNTAFGKTIIDFTAVVKTMTIEQLVTVLLTTIFVVGCTFILSYLIEHKRADEGRRTRTL